MFIHYSKWEKAPTAVECVIGGGGMTHDVRPFAERLAPANVTDAISVIALQRNARCCAHSLRLYSCNNNQKDRTFLWKSGDWFVPQFDKMIAMIRGVPPGLKSSTKSVWNVFLSRNRTFAFVHACKISLVIWERMRCFTDTKHLSWDSRFPRGCVAKQSRRYKQTFRIKLLPPSSW